MIRSFLHDTRGSIMVISAILMIPTLTLVGSGIDVGQAYMLREKMQNVLDGAALHGVKYLSSLSSSGLVTEVQRYVTLSFPSPIGGFTLDPVQATPNTTEKTLTLSLKGTLETSFLNLAGIPSLEINVQAVAQLSNPIQEIVLVLDNTSSMGQDSTPVGSIRNCSTLSCNKMQSMKHAASIFLDSQSANQQIHENTYIGLVPYTANFNIGTDHVSWTTGISGLNYGNSGWRGCVLMRHTNNYDVSDEPPSVAPFEPYLYPSTYGTLFWGSNNIPLKSNGRLVVGDNNWHAGNETDTLAGMIANGTNAIGPNAGCVAPMTPMTNSYSTVHYNISNMNGYSGGGTMTNIGLAGGFIMLSPK